MAETSATYKLTWKANFIENTGMYGSTLKWSWKFVYLTNFYVTQVIHHLHIPHMHLICPPKFSITFVFHFSWILQPPQEKLKTNAYKMQNFGKQIRCIMGDVQGHIKRNSKLNLMPLASNLFISHLVCILNHQLIFNILWHLWMASLKLYL